MICAVEKWYDKLIKEVSDLRNDINPVLSGLSYRWYIKAYIYVQG